jgi:hypothetical protein
MYHGGQSTRLARLSTDLEEIRDLPKNLVSHQLVACVSDADVLIKDGSEYSILP